MNKTIKRGFFLFIFVVVVAVGVKLVLPYFIASRQKATSDAAKTRGTIRIAMDNWIGYFPLCSPEMKNLMRRSGYVLSCEDDSADYASRMERLSNAEIEFAVATVDSYLLNAEKFRFPGVIIAVIDESKGGDAILARKDRVASLDDLKSKSDIRVAFTPDSPSHHLAKAAADHFAVKNLLPPGKLRVETDGSEMARKKLLSGDTDIAICWEPDVTKALSDGNIVKLLGTEDTERLIVDILIANRSFVQDNPELVRVVMNNYFRALKAYRNDSALLLDHVKTETGLSEIAVTSMLKGVSWANFHENCEKWFGIAAPGVFADEGLISTIDSTARILVNTGDFPATPVPNDDPYNLTNSSFLEGIFSVGTVGFTSPKTGDTAGPANSIEARFSELDEAGWQALKQVGTLKVEPVVFQAGTSDLNLMAKMVVDKAVERLKHYPNFRIFIEGHTDTRGDNLENVRLSRERAESVARYLQVTYNVDPNRMKIMGFGGNKPLPKKSGESRRAWMYRLPRVEFVLVREDF